jgi:uncharacterized membrane protein YczE
MHAGEGGGSMIEDGPMSRSDTGPRGGLTARLVQLIAGLVLFGVSLALLVRSELGLDPWDVFHQGLSVATGLSIGVCTIVAGVVVLLLWVPLRQRPGIGTVANVVLVGLSLDAVLLLIPSTGDLALRWTYLAVGIVLNGVATGAYIGAGLGPGPRDGLMVGLARGGRSIRSVRTAIEVSVLFVGWLLGGTVGIGTVLYALTIGPIVHRTVPAFSRDPRRGERRGGGT